MSKLISTQKYNDAMFFDATKETMLTFEMRDGYNLDTFHSRQQQFVSELMKIIQKNNLSSSFIIDPSTISTDVESKYVGKALGTKRFLQFLVDTNVSVSNFVTFGDSKSDFEISDELERNDKKVTMIYVGDKEKLGEIQRKYTIEFLGNYSQSTLDYLISH